MTKGREYYFFQVMIDRMALLKEGDGDAEDELVKDKLRRDANVAEGGSDSDEIDDAESTNLSLRETLKLRATGAGGFRPSSFSFCSRDEDEDDEDDDVVMWLDDEGQSMKVLFPMESSDSVSRPNASKSKETALAPSCLSTPIILKIIPAYKLPPPALRIRIPYTQQTVDIFQKPHTAYHIFLKQGRLSWRVVKRYSDFAKFVDQLSSNSAGVSDKVRLSKELRTGGAKRGMSAARDE
jgi:hypothetical protein